MVAINNEGKGHLHGLELYWQDDLFFKGSACTILSIYSLRIKARYVIFGVIHSFIQCKMWNQKYGKWIKIFMRHKLKAITTCEFQNGSFFYELRWYVWGGRSGLQVRRLFGQRLSLLARLRELTSICTWRRKKFKKRNANVKEVTFFFLLFKTHHTTFVLLGRLNGAKIFTYSPTQLQLRR